MKNLLLKYTAIILILISPSINYGQGDANQMININFGNLFVNQNNVGSIVPTSLWNSMYKGSSAYLLDDSGIQTACYLRSNSVKTIRAFGLSSDNDLTQWSTLSDTKELDITIYNIPYTKYSILLYVNKSGISNDDQGFCVNGRRYYFNDNANDSESDCFVIDKLKTDNIQLLIDKNIGVGAIQIIASDAGVYGVDENLLKLYSTLYPSTIHNSINLELKNCSNGNYHVLFYNLNGMLLYKERIVKDLPVQNYVIHPKGLFPGIYTVQVFGMEPVISKEIIVE